jgi:VWFA-related protein
MTGTNISALALSAALLLSTQLDGRQSTMTAPQERREAPPFRVGVDAVRIDAVVTDRDGLIVSNLTADDFEVRQDGKRQTVTFAQFMPVRISEPKPLSSTPSGSLAEATAVPSAPPKRADIQRTLAVVVDDLGLSVESLQNTRRALHEFVDRELQPTDLVALVRTGGSSGTLQAFTTDRRVLHAAIDGLHWNGASRNGVEPFESVNEWTTFDTRTGMPDVNDFKLVTQLRNSMSAAGTLGALNLVIRGTRDLPGRKAILFVSEGFQMQEGPEPDSRVRIALDRVIDQATRAGVVIYALDCRGLQTAGLAASDNLKRPRPGETMDTTVRAVAGERYEFNRSTQESLGYLAEQTGGFAVLNTNNLAGGLGRITDDLRGYYVIGYVPEVGTFAVPGKTPRFRKISIKVKQPGLQVRTRKEFLGISDPQETAGPATPAEQLVRAATSPFAATDIALRATALPQYSAEQGSFVRALLHVDARALAFVPGDDSRKTASVDVLGMVFDQGGAEVARLSTGFAVALTNEGADEALRDGLAYDLRIPIARPGGYQVRFAVRDRESGATGSAGEFVEMSDVRGGAFALSGIQLRPNVVTAGMALPSGRDVDQLALTSGEALRVFRPGTRLSYTYEIYNAATIQAVTSLWRGTERVFAAAPETLVRPAGAVSRFAAAGGLKLGDELLPGSYVLQVAATARDPNRHGRATMAVQRLVFDIERSAPK